MTRIRRLIPSPAMAVALLALFMAMGGSAYALVVTSGSIRNNTIRTQDVRNGGLVGKDVRANGLGGRAIKRGTPSAARTAEGRYQVIFDRDVRSCAYWGTIGGPTAAAPPDNGQITVSGLGTNINGVDIRTTGANGNDANKPFHLLVLC
jgi:hypothetical protein